jgi:hypothetical protein
MLRGDIACNASVMRSVAEAIGNESADVSPDTPASCPGVIAVASNGGKVGALFQLPYA